MRDCVARTLHDILSGFTGQPVYNIENTLNLVKEMMGKLRLLLPLSVLFVAAATLTAGWTLPLSVQRFKAVGGGPSTQASDLYVGFLQNRIISNAQTQAQIFITITTGELVPVNVTITYQTTVTQATVPAQGAISVGLPQGLIPLVTLDSTGRTVTGQQSISNAAINPAEVNKGVYITAANGRKISVYGVNGADASVDSFVAAPAVSYSFLGAKNPYPYEYYSFSTIVDPSGTTDNPGFMVVAVQNNTAVIYALPSSYVSKTNIYAPVPYRGYPAGGFPQFVTRSASNTFNYSMVLNQRQTYYFLGDKFDLTGIRIASSKPIAMYTGHACGYMSVPTCDHVVEQVTPTATWGKLFFSPPINGRTGGDSYRVIAMASGTSIAVTMSGSGGYISTQTYNLTKGIYKELSIPSNIFITIESNKPIYVMQYAKGNSANVPSSASGDPYIATIAPVEQYLSSYVVTTWEIRNFLASKVTPSTFVVAIAVLSDFYNNSQIFVDSATLGEATPGSPFTTGKWYPLYCSDGITVCGRGAIVPLLSTPGSVSRIWHSNPSAGIFVNVQGLNDQISFGHSAGYEVEALVAPAFSFTTTSASFSEGHSANVVGVAVVKQDDLQVLGTVTVNVTVSFPSASQLPQNTISAQPNVDYTSITTTLVFGPNDVQMFVNFTILGNRIPQSNRQFYLTLSSSVPVSPYATSTVTIIDDDGAQMVRVEFNPTVYTTTTDAGSVNLLVQRSGILSSAVTVNISTASLTAIDGLDFVGISQTITFQPDNNPMSTVSIPVAIINRNIAGPSTSFLATLTSSNPTVTLGANQSTVNIINNNVPTVTLTSTSYMTQKGQPAQVCVTKDLATASDITGVITAYPIEAPNAATPLVQFTNGSYPFTLAAGPAGTQTCVNINTLDDRVQGGLKVFNVSIGQTSSTGGGVNVGTPSNAQVTIVDTTVVPFSFVNATVTVAKNGNAAQVCLQKMGASSQSIAVTLNTTPLTATSGVDFTPVQTSLTFLSSDTIKCISIPILDNGIAFTGDKTFKVVFNTPSTTLYPKGPIPESTVTIQDQSVVSVSFTKPLYVVQQSQGPAVVCIVATPSAAVPINVTVAAGENPVPSARASTDFSAGSYVITIPANTPNTPFCTNIPIVDNQVAFQPNRTFTVTLQPPNPRVIASTPSQVLIVDDYKITLTPLTPNGTYTTVPQVCFKSDRNVATNTVVNMVVNFYTVSSVRMTVYTTITFSPNKNTSCVDLTNSTQIRNVTVNPVPQPNILIPPLKPGTDTTGIDIITPTQPPPQPTQSTGITVNDTVIGDPLYAVPLLLNISNPLDGPALCYEVHGAANRTFNLVSDHCTSVNAFYSPAISVGDPVPINVISKIGIVAKDISGSCQMIQVNLDGCTAFVNGIQVTTSYQQGEIGVRKIGDRVRVSVPNCGSPNLVSWIVCEQVLGVNMIRFVISRGLNLRPTSHGIIGQFWNIPISMVHYSGSLPQGYDSTDPLYIVTVKPALGPPRSFLGDQYSRTWDNTQKTCYYSGNAQGGSTGVASPDDSVIEGTYTDYATSDIFSPQFRYNQFQGCAA